MQNKINKKYHIFSFQISILKNLTQDIATVKSKKPRKKRKEEEKGKGKKA